MKKNGGRKSRDTLPLKQAKICRGMVGIGMYEVQILLFCKGVRFHWGILFYCRPPGIEEMAEMVRFDRFV